MTFSNILQLERRLHRVAGVEDGVDDVRLGVSCRVDHVPLVDDVVEQLMLVAQAPFQCVVVVFVSAFVVEVKHARVERVARVLDVCSNSLISNDIALLLIAWICLKKSNPILSLDVVSLRFDCRIGRPDELEVKVFVRTEIQRDSAETGGVTAQLLSVEVHFKAV